MTADKQTTLHIRLPEPLRRAAKVRAAEAGISMATYLRRSLEKWVAEDPHTAAIAGLTYQPQLTEEQ